MTETAPLRWAETVDTTDGGRTLRISGYGPDGTETGGITVDRINAAVLRDMLTDILRTQPTPDCARCKDHRVVPDWTNWDAYHGEPKPKPCPDCTPTEGQ